MKKPLSAILVLILIVGIFFLPTLQANEIRVTIDGDVVYFEGQLPTIADGRNDIEHRIMLPVRGIFEHLGFDVEWAETIVEGSPAMLQHVVLTRDDTEIRITILDGLDFGIFTVNGVHHIWGIELQIINGRTLVSMWSIRHLLEVVEHYILWERVTNTAIISSAPFDIYHIQDELEEYRLDALLELAAFLSNMEHDFLINVVAPLVRPLVPYGITVDLGITEDMAIMLLWFDNYDWDYLISNLNEDDLESVMHLLKAFH
ncbi:MAG: copper amine oxidase N-terminal domain-containing protein [Defluviitaleaceae bacterium]|nr:copper amine oxidase N-terminal domain-containing protein [Defluviitaleaceae bacterium]